jgi:hypothetical protein
MNCQTAYRKLEKKVSINDRGHFMLYLTSLPKPWLAIHDEFAAK